MIEGYSLLAKLFDLSALKGMKNQLQSINSMKTIRAVSNAEKLNTH